MKMKKKCLLALVLLATALCLCSCKENPTGEELFGKLVGHFASSGFTCVLEPVEAGRAVPIYNASVWYSLKLDGEEVLVYFDESNRADYLSTFTLYKLDEGSTTEPTTPIEPTVAPTEPTQAPTEEPTVAPTQLRAQ